MANQIEHVIPVKRVFDWPMIFQSALFIITLVGIAIVSEHRITAVEQALVAQTDILSKLQAQQLRMGDIQMEMTQTQTRLLVVTEFLAKRTK